MDWTWFEELDSPTTAANKAADKNAEDGGWSFSWDWLDGVGDTLGQVANDTIKTTAQQAVTTKPEKATDATVTHADNSLSGNEAKTIMGLPANAVYIGGALVIAGVVFAAVKS